MKYNYSKLSLTLFGLIMADFSLAEDDKQLTDIALPAITISADPLAKNQQQMTTPSEILEGDKLTLNKQATLGETLNNLSGVRSSSFGAGASRPVIRGLDGARVKVLNNGMDVMDASTISADHNVAIEPMFAKKIEVLKGPATLLYGGGAIGGVVNIVDSKIPTYVPAKGYEGDAEYRMDHVSNESTGLIGVTAGTGNVAIRAEGLKRNQDEYRIPGHEHKQKGSYNDSNNGSLGISWITDQGYIGTSFSRQYSRYGLLAHEHAHCHTHGTQWHCGSHGGSGGHSHDHDEEGVPYIEMVQRRWDLRGEYQDPFAGFENIKFSGAHTDYQHDEKEGGEVATRFKGNTNDMRVELTHQPLWGWRGVIGGQTYHRNFSVKGEEAYIPSTTTKNHAIFLLEEYTINDWRYELGVRNEWQDIATNNQQPNKNHHGTSFSAGTVWNFIDNYSLGLSLSRSQRLPTVEELYAYGPHAASRTVELGNSKLDVETSHNIDLTLRKYAGDTQFTVSVYRNQIKDFIYAADTGNNIGGGYREIAYTQKDAVLTGIEGDIRFQLTDRMATTFFGDYVRGKLKNGGGDIPRMSPARLGVRLDTNITDNLDGAIDYSHNFKQNKTAHYETKTSGYNLVDASLTYHGKLAQTDYQVYLKGSNLLNSKYRNHNSFIKDDVLQPGRNFTAGVKLSF